MRGSKKMTPRVIAPDPKYGNVTLAKFINYVMKGGKKSTALRVVYGAMEQIEEISKGDPLKVFDEAVKNVQPQVEVRSRRVGGANYQVPLPVSGRRQNGLTFRWIIGAARAKKGQPMFKRLAIVLIDASQGTGDAVKKRDDMHRMAEANKAFAHFARFVR